MRNHFLTTILVLFIVTSYGQQHYSKSVLLMGSDFKITVVANSKQEGEKYINLAIAEIERIEQLISSWDPNSQTSLINKNAGINPVVVNQELFDLIQRSKKLSELTGGAFDVSFASMDKIWKFDGSVTTMPPANEVKASVEKVGYNNIVMNPEATTVFLRKKGMKIGFGAIGKGYAADKAKELLIAKGVTAGIINASGDLTTWGNKPDGKPWVVGIKSPLNKNKVFAWFPVDNRAIVTSGNYEKYVVINGTRYTHIINPKTGYPSQGVISASVFAPKAELADALATSIFVLGLERGLYFINQLNGIDCVIVTDTGKIHYSNNIQNEIQEN